MTDLTDIERAIIDVFHQVDEGLSRADAKNADAKNAHYGDEAREIVKVSAYSVGNTVRIDVKY